VVSEIPDGNSHKEKPENGIAKTKQINKHM